MRARTHLPTHSVVTGKGMTFNGYIAKMTYKYTFCFACPLPFMSLPTWISCFYSWIMLVDQGTKFQYHCELCGIYPSWICFDGVSLACLKRHIQWTTVDQVPNESDPIKQDRIKEVPKAKRLMIPKKEDRIALREFITDCITELVAFQTLVTMLKETGIDLLLKHLYDTEVALSGKCAFVRIYQLIVTTYMQVEG